MPDFPKSLRVIHDRLANLGKLDVARKSKIIANVIAAQMLPPSALRGGTSIKIKFGDALTRGSSDLDVALKGDRNKFIQEFKENLALGWNGFTGVLTESRNISRPADIPTTYVTETWNLKLSFKGSEWQKQEIDIGHDEIGDTLDFSEESSEEINEWFELCGLPIPSPIRVIKGEYPIAQKIYALASDPDQRIHDLVDIQVLVKNEGVNLKELQLICTRLFGSRRLISWPPTFAYNKAADARYANAIEETGLIDDLEEAVRWLNDFINEIVSAN